MISPKLLIPTLSGFGITAAGLVASWQLSQENKKGKENTKPNSYETGEELANKSRGDEPELIQKTEEICGENIWSSGIDHGRKNSKEHDFQEWKICADNLKYSYHRYYSDKKNN